MDTPCSIAAKCSDDEIGTHDHDESVGHTEFDAHAEDWYRDPGSGKKTPDGRRRRRAMERCWNDCPFRARLICLDKALEQGPEHQFGIWGGYTEDQRIQILQERARREDLERERVNQDEFPVATPA